MVRELEFLSQSRETFSERKKNLLRRLASPSKTGKYKRYIGSPLRYAGGKSLAVGYVVQLLPDNIERLVSPFFGGASVEVACAVDLNIQVIGADIFDILMNYWKVQIDNPSALYERLLEFEPDRNGFKAAKDRLKKHWDKTELITDEIELAAYFYFNHNTSYGPHFLGWPSSVYLQTERYRTMIEKVRCFDAPNLQVFCESFEDFIQKYPNDFLYCDPPYYLDGDSKTFVGLYPHRNFPIYHNNFKHRLLYELLMEHKGGFILSYNDCSTIRKWYDEFDLITPSWQYTLSQGDTRIGENRRKNNNGLYVKQSHELLIWRYPR
ncbi:MAG: DNA adenine methylase [Calditrichaeota bacterium]|nr:DNA adenine methylase [Calditrichota bacterium]